MIFALIDYSRYRCRTGRFARDFGITVMGGAFEDAIPDAALELLHAGDVIVVQTLDKFASWVIMYLTQSEVSHVAMYLGGRRISHATPAAGVTIEMVDALFKPNSRLLPCIRKMPDETRAKIPDHVAESWEGRPYAMLLVLLKGLSILSAHNWPAFRWKFFIDVVLAVVAIDLPFLLLMVLFNAARWKLRRPKMSELFLNPSDSLQMIVASGGAILIDGIDVRRQTMAGREREQAVSTPMRDDTVIAGRGIPLQNVPSVLRFEFADLHGSSVTISAPGVPSLGVTRYFLDDIDSAAGQARTNKS
jgi:hypothetical protein